MDKTFSKMVTKGILLDIMYHNRKILPISSVELAADAHDGPRRVIRGAQNFHVLSDVQLTSIAGLRNTQVDPAILKF